MNIIDPHLHFFNLSQGDYHWLRSEQAPFWPDKHLIQRDFSEVDLRLEPPLKLAGFVHIEAGFNNQQPWREIAWLEQHCHLPFRSIGYLNLSLPIDEFLQKLKQLTSYQSVIGIRDILDDDTHTKLKQTDTKEKLQSLADSQLSFELQMPISQIENVDLLCQLIAQVSELRVQINHAGWPPVSDIHTENSSQSWLQGMKLLSQLNNCTIKCSGWEILDRHYQLTQQHQTIEQCLNVFGEDSVMLASNFPLTLFSKSYQDYWQQLLLGDLATTLGNDLIKKLCYQNANTHYQFNL